MTEEQIAAFLKDAKEHIWYRVIKDLGYLIDTHGDKRRPEDIPGLKDVIEDVVGDCASGLRYPLEKQLLGDTEAIRRLLERQ